jgi:hypothetical protein
MHRLQIITLLPAPVNFLPDTMALASNYVRPQQATTCLRLAWFAVRTKTLRLRVIEISMEKFLERFDYRTLAKWGESKVVPSLYSLLSFGSSILKHTPSIHLLWSVSNRVTIR